nr:hypothetical protein [Burkholderia ubonensis]
MHDADAVDGCCRFVRPFQARVLESLPALRHHVIAVCHFDIRDAVLVDALVRCDHVPRVLSFDPDRGRFVDQLTCEREFLREPLAHALLDLPVVIRADENVHIRICGAQMLYGRQNAARIEAHRQREGVTCRHADRSACRVTFGNQHHPVVRRDVAEQVRRPLLLHALVEALRAVRRDLLQTDQTRLVVTILEHWHEHRAVFVESDALWRDLLAVQVRGGTALVRTAPLVMRAVRCKFRLPSITLGLLALDRFLPTTRFRQLLVAQRGTVPTKTLGAGIVAGEMAEGARIPDHRPFAHNLAELIPVLLARTIAVVLTVRDWVAGR